jgi:hypothetical protein
MKLRNDSRSSMSLCPNLAKPIKPHVAGLYGSGLRCGDVAFWTRQTVRLIR